MSKKTASLRSDFVRHLPDSCSRLSGTAVRLPSESLFAITGIRSLGGWEAVRKLRIDGQERLKGDQRILGDSGFVSDLLREADEKFERHYEMKRMGYDLDKIEKRICEIYPIEKGDIFTGSRERLKADARALFCFWAVRELGYGQRELARRLGMTQPGVGYAVIKGEAISKSNGYRIK